MSILSMASEVLGVVPRMSIDYAYTCVYRATMEAYRKSFWSFLTFEGNWTTPSWVQGGTVNVTQGQNTIQFDPLVATPIVNAIGTQPSPVTKRQFRIGVGTIYNIWQYDGSSGTVNTSGTTATYVSGAPFNPAWNGLQMAINGVVYTVSSYSPGPSPTFTLNTSAGTQAGVNYQIGGIATLDRPYQESSAAASAYTIFQCYYASPVADWKAWASIRDMLNWNDLYFTNSRAWLDLQDPQRVINFIPTQVVPYELDLNPLSSTYGWQLFELWGVPTYQLTYQLYGYRKGFVNVNGADVPLVGPGLNVSALADPSQSLPMQIGEDCVMAKARTYAYAWAEANREPNDRRNYSFLQNQDIAEFGRQFREYRKQDRALFDAFHVKFRRTKAWPNYDPQYNAIAGTASPGASW